MSEQQGGGLCLLWSTNGHMDRGVLDVNFMISKRNNSQKKDGGGWLAGLAVVLEP